MKILRIVLLIAAAWLLCACSSTDENGVMIEKSFWIFGVESSPAQNAGANA